MENPLQKQKVVQSRWNRDPKTNPSISTYATFANNPIMYADPMGDTVISLIDRQGAGNQGHMGTAFQDGKGTWYYASQGAAGNPGQGSMLAGSDADGGIQLIKLSQVSYEVPKLDSKGNQVYDKNGNAETETKLRNMTAREVKSAALSNKLNLGYNYDEAVQLNTTPKQDAQIYKNAINLTRDYKTGKEEYNLYFNNCVDACQDIIQNKTNINLPVDFDPRPNSYFNKMKEFSKEFNKKP